jgi:hypothetical protein
MVMRNDPQRDVLAQKATVFCTKISPKIRAIRGRWEALLTTTVPNLGDILPYGNLGIAELPTHSNSYLLRMISVRYRVSGLS